MKTVAKRLSAKLLIVVIGKAWQSGHDGHCAFKRRLWGSHKKVILAIYKLWGTQKQRWYSGHLHIVEQLKVRGLQASTQCLLASYWPRSWKMSQDENIGGKKSMRGHCRCFLQGLGDFFALYKVL